MLPNLLQIDFLSVGLWSVIVRCSISWLSLEQASPCVYSFELDHVLLPIFVLKRVVTDFLIRSVILAHNSFIVIYSSWAK